MTKIQQLAAQAARENRYNGLPCGNYEPADIPASTLSMRALEAQFNARIIKEYGSIEAYNNQRFQEGNK